MSTFTFRKGLPIAKIYNTTDKKLRGKVLKLKKEVENNLVGHGYDSYSDSDSDSDNQNEIYNIISDDFLIKKAKRILKSGEIDEIRSSLYYDKPPRDIKLHDLYYDAKKLLDLSKGKSISISGSFQPIPNEDIEREIIYTAGASGSGKSTWASKYIQEYNKCYPNNRIIIFSRIDHDKAYDDLYKNGKINQKPMRIKLDETLIDDPIELEELRNSICIFDDIDSMKEKDLQKEIYRLRSEILLQGRHFHITAIIMNHQIMDFKNTRDILNESHKIIMFPKSGSSYHIKRCLKEYCGVSEEDIKKIMKLPSRWFMIHRHYPNYIVSEHDAFFL